MATATSYLPPGAGLGMSMPSAAGKGMDTRPQRRILGMQTRKEDLGSPIGRRGAGLTSLGGGDQGAHTFNHYGKNGPPGLTGGEL